MAKRSKNFLLTIFSQDLYIFENFKNSKPSELSKHRKTTKFGPKNFLGSTIMRKQQKGKKKKATFQYPFHLFLSIQFSRQNIRDTENMWRHYWFQRDLQICWWLFFHRSYIFCLLMKHFIRNKNFCFLKKLYEIVRNFRDKIVHLENIYKFILNYF